MAFTQADLDAINAAIAGGELTIGLGDMRITYRSTDELLKAKAAIEADLALQASASTPRPYPRHMLADFSDE